jgi:hypothetical protein
MHEAHPNIIYQGKIIGDHSRLFFSIPTARANSLEYFNIHYLLDTGCPYSTLTHEALCCLYAKDVSNHSVVFPSVMNILIGGNTV